jgi:hypothetical protein
MSVDAATITKRFSTAFDPTNETHVLWFKRLHDTTEEGKSIDKVLEDNPFGLHMNKRDMMEWIHIQFVLAMKYATSVLNGRAWVPGHKIEVL